MARRHRARRTAGLAMAARQRPRRDVRQGQACRNSLSHRGQATAAHVRRACRRKGMRPTRRGCTSVPARQSRGPGHAAAGFRCPELASGCRDLFKSGRALLAYCPMVGCSNIAAHDAGVVAIREIVERPQAQPYHRQSKTRRAAMHASARCAMGTVATGTRANS